MVQTKIGGYDRGHCVRVASAWRAQWNSTHARYGTVIHNSGCGDKTTIFFNISGVSDVAPFLGQSRIEGLNTYVFTAAA